MSPWARRKASAACRSAHQHPSVGQLLVAGLQLVGVLQHGKQLALGLQHVGGHAGIVLAGHTVQELVEAARLCLRQFQGIQHADGLLQVVVATGGQLLLVLNGLVGGHKLLHRLVAVHVEGQQVYGLAALLAASQQAQGQQ